MPDESTGGGNPNFFTTFKQRAVLSPAAGASFTSVIVMLSCTNDVQILGDCDLSSYSTSLPDAVIATLPEECRPGREVRVPVALAPLKGEADAVSVLKVGVNGEVSIPADVAKGIVYLSGLSFSISNKWYA